MVRRHPRARRMKLRFDPHQAAAIVTVPSHLPAGSAHDLAHAFASEHRAWLRAEMARYPAENLVRPGGFIAFRGHDHKLLHRADLPGGVHHSEGRIHVGGPIHGFEKRLELWLRKEARHSLEAQARSHAERLEVRFRRLRITDTKSRWGSCSGRGVLSFSWRLVMAPERVLDYVAAHEVAHLKEMNHSAAFWALVDRLVPHAKTSRAWLRQHGPALMALRFDPHPNCPPLQSPD
ncbi:M48 family metallopeptidase [Luteithermobacter gelatinilyticus]|uniref:M48 family metallopeptidase n=1 Tax=Luteithermobacter gelatinilyticus TaxID=2582913 RepID=UPI001106CF0C|nr:SprT family zinc-dependent metalloprotease [Luteithermobacter gelatinilyticus]